MLRTIHRSLIAAVILALSAGVYAEEAAKPQAAEAPAPRVQLAILLDTSGSMQGLIEQAKSELWKIVNELIAAKQNGKAPQLQVALYEYGKSSLAAESNWVRQIVPLTDDLDKVSEELFKLTTNGGEEYCGAVIDRATKELAWSASPNDLKMIVIAGNEPFSQGPIDYRTACRDAIAKGIIVNTIHCGGGVPDDWRDGAVLADGKAMNIDQNAVAVHVDAPQDKQIAELGVKLNETYIAYGAHGDDGKVRQEAQDANAAGQSIASAQQRAVTKANGYYSNARWDLIDAAKEKDFDLSKVKTEDLPENMRKMTPAEREAYVGKMKADREQLSKQINDLNAEREKFVTEKRKELAEQDGATLDTALIGAIREQAGKKSFDFGKGGE